MRSVSAFEQHARVVIDAGRQFAHQGIVLCGKPGDFGFKVGYPSTQTRDMNIEIASGVSYVSNKRLRHGSSFVRGWVLGPFGSVFQCHTSRVSGSTLSHYAGVVPEIFSSPTDSWTGVSPRLATIRIIISAISVVPLLLGGIALAFVVSWLGGIVFALGIVIFVWVCWWAPRNQQRWGYAETDESLYIVSGRFWRQVVAIPYGRIQYVDVSAGPLATQFHLASLEIHTASPHTSGVILGVPETEAARLRDRLTDLADAWSPGV
jgi:uncharacterized protein